MDQTETLDYWLGELVSIARQYEGDRTWESRRATALQRLEAALDDVQRFHAAALAAAEARGREQVEPLLSCVVEGVGGQVYVPRADVAKARPVTVEDGGDDVMVTVVFE